MNWKATATEILLLALSLALGLTLHGSAAQIALFAVAGLLLLALIFGAIWSSEWFWRRVATRVRPYLAADSSTTGPTPEATTDEELVAAVDDLLDELATIHGRLSDAIDAGFYSYKFFLPSAAYTANRNVIGARSGQAREVLSEVYVQADALNDKMPGGDSDGIALEHVPSPDAARLREIVSRAQAAIRQIRPRTLSE